MSNKGRACPVREISERSCERTVWEVINCESVCVRVCAYRQQTQAVVNYLASQGLTNIHVEPNNLFITATAQPRALVGISYVLRPIPAKWKDSFVN